MNLKKTIKNLTLLSAINSIYRNYFKITRRKFGYIHPSAFYRQPFLVKGIENVYMYENTSILGHAIILTTNAKLIIKKNSGAAEGLTVVTGNHDFKVGFYFKDVSDKEKTKDNDKDVIVEEDVWMATNVTLLAGVNVGRGAVIGSGSVVRSKVPPYSIVIGNPAKVVGFKFTPEEIIEHEKILYPEEERFSLEVLEKNYQKYFLERINEIKALSKL
jgi:acetyltransferase-like isoleucine patch superfamily enzyme